MQYELISERTIRIIFVLFCFFVLALAKSDFYIYLFICLLCRYHRIFFFPIFLTSFACLYCFKSNRDNKKVKGFTYHVFFSSFHTHSSCKCMLPRIWTFIKFYWLIWIWHESKTCSKQPIPMLWSYVEPYTVMY